jgi:hypothetical protein
MGYLNKPAMQDHPTALLDHNYRLTWVGLRFSHIATG